MALQVYGKLEIADYEEASFAECRIEALFGRRRTPEVIESDLGSASERVATAIAGATSAAVPIPSKVSTMSDAAGNFTLVFPDSQEIGEKVKIEVFSPLGLIINKEKDFAVADLENLITIEVEKFGPTTLYKPVEPTKPETRRIRGRVIERRGKQLPPKLQVLLLGHERGTQNADSLTPILVAKADSSGYFSGAIKNLEFDRVVAVITGIPGDIPVQLVDWLVPPRIPIVVELPDTPVGPSSKDCGCSNSALPRTPTQDDIAEEPGVFSADLGAGQCIRFNVPNRAIEEFNFYSVVRTTEPQVVGVTVGVLRDEPVEVPKPPIKPEEAPTSEAIAKAIALAHRIETDILAALDGLTWATAQILKTIRPGNITWGEIESLFRTAVVKAEGTPLPPAFFDSFPNWGEGEVWDSGPFILDYWKPTDSQGGGRQVTTPGFALSSLNRFEEVIKKAALVGATPPASPGVPQFKMTPIIMTAGRLDPDVLTALYTRTRDGRVVMNKATPVDWDETPTFHQAASISHGHLLHFKQVWYADGYSLGDLLYSLPLAPGQKKLISVVDWERREQTARDEFTSAEEGLQAALSRDRDLSEVVSGTLSESSRGESHNKTVGFGAGKGSAVSGSYQGFNFGGVMGVSGGFGESDSNAFMVSSRDLSASSLQTLRDRTLQSASAVRNVRSTIVQTARQGETVRATTEVVANHNHCHALTIQYFEVLRHFKVTNELANVQECLFVPLPMSEFNRQKVLRWRESLSTYLKQPELAPALDATRRIETGWSEEYTPAARYADERVSAIFGELTLTIFIPLPPFPEKPTPKPGETLEQIEAARRKALAPAEDAFRIISGVLTLGASEITRAAVETTKAIVQDARAMTESLFDEPSAEERYARFQQEVMPAAAAGFVDQLELYALVGDSEKRLDGADFTMVSEYRPGTPLLVSVRGKITTPVTRASIAALVIKSGVPLPAGCRVIVNSASLRYQTDNFRHDMINDQRVNDDIDLPIIASTGTPTLPALPIPLPLGFPTNWNKIPGVAPIRSGNGAMLYSPLDEWEQRSPRHEDVRLSAKLVEHLNTNLEYYHHAIWWTMDPNRRYMLLDGYQAPNAGGRSVASVVDNTLIGIIGNSLILPVAPGNRLNTTYELATGVTLLEHYDPQVPAPPSRVSLPTRGVFAEAVMGDCNACEEIDDTRFWRWEESPIDEPPALDMAAVASRRSEPNYGTPTPFPTPIVNIQNAPQAPDPAGVKAGLDAITKQTFADITGLAGTQANAAAAFSKAMDTALAFGKEASQLAQQAAMTKNIGQTMRAIDKAEGENKIDQGDAKQLRTSALKTMAGDGPSDPKAASVADRLKVIDDQVAKGSLGEEQALQQRTEILKGLEPEDRTKIEESRAAIEAMRKMQNLESVETRDADGDATTIKAQPVGFDPSVARRSEDAFRWKDLLSFKPSKQLLDDIATRGLQWQRIQDAQGDVNLDVYMLEVKRLPRRPGGAATLDDTEFFEYIRISFPRLLPTFTIEPGNSLVPYADRDDTAWKSASPLGAVMLFKLALGPLPEWALVLCAKHDAVTATDKHWNFVTLGGRGLSGYHPVSGTRQFGIRRFGVGGPLFFYIRAADRVTGSDYDLVPNPETMFSEIVFQGGHEYWLELLERLKQDITLNGGEAGRVSSESRRHPWTKASPYVYISEA